MKRSRAITLVLLGGGVALGLGACGDSRHEECERARRELRPDAEQICARATSSSHHRSGSSSWFFGRSGSSSARHSALAGNFGGGSSRVATSSRGGFGSIASRFSSSS